MSQLYDDLMEGLLAAEKYLKGEIQLKTQTLTKPDPVQISADEIKSIRENLHLSQHDFAQKLRASVRTYQGWEQGKTKPNAQAALLLKMVQQNPQMFEMIARI